MATTLVIPNFKASVGWDIEKTNSFGQNTTNIFSFAYSMTFANGSGNGKAQSLYAGALTITTGSTTTLDFGSADVITDANAVANPLGDVVTFLKIKGIFVQHATPAASGSLELAGSWFVAGPLTGTTPKLIMYGGMTLLLGGGDATNDVGWAVTDATADVMTLKNNDAASITVNVVLIGE